MDPWISYKIHTFGCKVNTYDTGLLQKRMNSSGYLESNEPRVHLLNTCAVTAEATKEAIRYVRRLKVQDPFCKVIVTGCAAQVDTEKFATLSGVDLVVANSHKGKLESLVRGLFSGQTKERIHKSNIFRKDDLESGGGIESDHTRSFLKIQDGCNSFCSFCVIPFARGKSRSLPVSELIRRVRELNAQEVVLTGVHIGDYEDGEKKLEDLIEDILLLTKVPRIRLTSLEPIEISDRLLDLYQDERLCPHFHMSIQSANSKVLSEMKRRYGSREVEDSLIRIAKKVPSAFVGMDVIAGFPGESESEFQDTYERLNALPWTRLHVFPYSTRPGTKASRMAGHMERSEIKARSKMLNSLSRERYLQAAIAQMRTQKLVLGIRSSNHSNLAKLQTIRGISRDYWNIQLTAPMEIGSEAAVKVIGHSGFELNEGNPYLTCELQPA